MAALLVALAYGPVASPVSFAQTAPAALPALGAYEQQALAQALAARALELDPAPQGKTIAAIVVYNLDVFGPEDGWLRFVNVFHRTTREHIIEREVLLRPGDLWNDEIAQESRRRLTAGEFSSLVVIVPVKAADPERINLLVVTRDIWSLRLNSNFEFQDGVLSFLRLQPAENNLLGWRKALSLVFDMNLGRYAAGPSYYDSNIAGTRWVLSASAFVLVGRDSGEAEGSSSALGLQYPLWSFARKWGASASFGHSRSVARRFLGPDLRLFDDPATMAVETIPWRYSTRSLNADAGVTRQFGSRVINRISLGYDFSLVRNKSFDADFVAAPAARPAFEAVVLPRSERTSALTAGYAVFAPNFVVLRNVETFDFPEDTQVGPSLGVGADWANPAFGSENAFVRVGGTLSWRAAPGGDSLLFASVGGETRRQDGAWIDNSYGTTLSGATPRFAFLRLVGRVRFQRIVRNGRVPALYLGGDSGLRGYAIDAFQGQALALGALELRTHGLKVFSLRAGAVLFWDVGHVAPTFDDLSLQQDVGLGLRVLVPQFQRTVIRLDWAVANRGPTAGLPGRFSAGFTQAF